MDENLPMGRNFNAIPNLLSNLHKSTYTQMLYLHLCLLIPCPCQASCQDFQGMKTLHHTQAGNPLGPEISNVQIYITIYLIKPVITL